MELAVATFVGSIIIQKVLSFKQDSKPLQKSQTLKNKFEKRDGITFFYFPRSPCARRVWLTLQAKKIHYHCIMVDLMKGEQRHPDFLQINPQGKVPAIRVWNHPTIPNCNLYESQAIVEWLEEQFPDSPKLYPSISEDIFGYLETKMFQYWELTLAEEIWPLSRQQIDGCIWRFLYSRDNFFKIGPPAQENDDPFYQKKVTQIYEGKYISMPHARRSVIRILKGFQMLENELSNRTSIQGRDSPHFLLGNFSQADIAGH